MERLTAREVLAATGGTLLQGAPVDAFSGVSTDSRQTAAGELFVPLVGENFDGHAFLVEAARRGAAGLLLALAPQARPEERLADLGLGLPLESEGRRPFIIGLPDTGEALRRLAAAYRQRFNIPVVGVTGSVGKTTTKDLIASVLRERWRTVATQANFNNEVGLPLTIFRMDHQTEAAVLELGMRGPGQIRQLAEVAHPTVGVITNIGETHLELLGSRENIARAKGELIEALPPSGVAVLNGDDERVAGLAALAPGRVLRYGVLRPGETLGRVDVGAANVESFGVHGITFTLVVGDSACPIELPLPGAHNVSNALAAAAAGLALGLSLGNVQAGLGSATITAMRLQTSLAPGGFLVINDAYNASPASTRAALRLLVESRMSGRTVAVLGDMLELGSIAEEAHRETGAYAASLGVERLLGVGPLSAHTVHGAREQGLATAKAYNSTESALGALHSTLAAGDVVLVKGSRGMHMEEVVRGLLGNGGTEGA